MGLIKSFSGTMNNTIANQWQDFYYCESMTNNELMKKGKHRSLEKKSFFSLNKSEEHIVTNGSKIIVGQNQCMVIVYNGRVTEICSEPGEYIFDTSSSPSIFAGGSGQEIVNAFKESLLDFRYENVGDSAIYIYYLNTKEILDNRTGCSSPIIFREYVPEIESYININIRWSCNFSYKIANPMSFYSCYNMDRYSSSFMNSMYSKMKEQFGIAMKIALDYLSKMKISYNEIVIHKNELYSKIYEELRSVWYEQNGIVLESISCIQISTSKEEKEKVDRLLDEKLQNDYQNIVPSHQSTHDKATEHQTPHIWQCSCGMPNTGKFCSACGMPSTLTEDKRWTCECQTVNYGKYCTECGKPKPPVEWKCSCGTLNTGKFCTNCGKKGDMT